MNFKIHTGYIFKKNKTTFHSDWISDIEIMPIINDIEKTGRFQEIVVEDETGLTWNKKELQKLLTKIEDEPDEITIYFDGSYEKETNKAGLGAVIYYRLGKKQIRHRFNQPIEQMDSNNEAEYAALYFCLNQMEELDIRGKKITICGDSQGLIMQLLDEWPCYEDNLNRWLDRIEAKIKHLNLYPEYRQIPRNENKEADKLASQAIQGVEISSKQIL